MRTKFKVLSILALSIILISLSALSTGAVNSTFQIGIYWPPPVAYTTDTQYDYIRDANVNYIINVDSTDIDTQAQNTAALDKCSSRGIKFVVADSAYNVSTATNAQLDAYADIYKNHAAIGGFYIKDEPEASAYTWCANAYNRFLAKVPSSYNYVNLLPRSDITGYIQPWVNAVGATNLKYLIHDCYPFDVSSGINATYFDVLRAYRSVGLSNNVDTSCFLQSVAWNGGSRRPNANECRWNVYTALAYGMKGLNWFTWWQPTGQGQTFTTAIMDASGNKTDLYSVVQGLNSEIKTLGPTLMTLHSQAVYHAGSLPTGTVAVPSDFFWQTTTTYDQIVSYFTDSSNRTYIMVVNRDYQSSRTLSFNIPLKPTGVTEISKTTGAPVSTNYSSSTGNISATFNPGEGKLYLLSSDFVLPTNLVTNPGFESGMTGWSTSGSNPEADNIEAGGRTGSRLAHWKDAAYNVYTYQTKTGLTNGTYTMKAWIKNDYGGLGTAYMEAKDYGGANKICNIPTSAAWTQISITDISVTNGQCTIGFYSNSPANTWYIVDDVEFYKQPTPLNLVTNPGFESGMTGWSTGGSNPEADAIEAGGRTGSRLAHWKDAAYNVYTYQTKTGLTNGTYTMKAWIKNDYGGLGTAYMEAKDYGGANKICNIPTSAAWTQISITDISVTNGQCTIGFYSNSPANTWYVVDDVEFYKN